MIELLFEADKRGRVWLVVIEEYAVGGFLSVSISSCFYVRTDYESFRLLRLIFFNSPTFSVSLSSEWYFSVVKKFLMFGGNMKESLSIYLISRFNFILIFFKHQWSFFDRNESKFET